MFYTLQVRHILLDKLLKDLVSKINERKPALSGFLCYNESMNFKFDKSKLKIGMRTAKTGLAVFLVLLLFGGLDWEGAQIAALTAVFSLREDFDKSLSFGTSRILGNTIGGLMALVFYLVGGLFGHHHLVGVIFLPILTMLTIVLNVALDNASGVVGAVSALLIISLAAPTGSTFIYVVTRVFQTFIGVFAAILVNSDITTWRKLFKK